MLDYVLLLLAAYVLGGIPFPYLIVKAALGKDVREHGSGNVGATNASRMFARGKQTKLFLGIFFLDGLKGFLATWLLPSLIEPTALAPVVAGAAAVLGHNFSPFLRFSGGKGVSTTMGVFVALEPVATGVAIAVWLLVYALTRVVSVASLTFAVALPAAVFIHGQASLVVKLLTIVLALMIVVRHQSNIVNLVRGQET